MASAEQLKALIKSHIEGDESHFYSVAMQMAAHEARLGHGKLAQELRALIDEAKKNKPRTSAFNKPILLAKPRGELSSLLLASWLPLLVVRLEGLITKFMGETSAKLRIVFDAIAESRGVYLFDEFDSIGSHRGQINEVGEIRRILNSFLQMIEQDDSNSIILAATNHPDILDYALYRRFDDVVEYSLPDKPLINKLLKNRLSAFKISRIPWKKISDEAEGLSHAEISKICEDAIKDAIIDDRDIVTANDLLKLISERKKILNKQGSHSKLI